jgi:hypothetical protein
MYKAQQVIKDKFWIVNSDYGKVGTLRKRDDGKFDFFNQTTEESQTLDSIDDLFVIEESNNNEKELVVVKGLPTGFTSAVEVEGYDFPVFKKSKTSTTLHAAGYWIIEFTGSAGWQWAVAPKLSTLDKYNSRGPFLTEWEANLEIKKSKRNIPDDEKKNSSSDTDHINSS